MQDFRCAISGRRSPLAQSGRAPIQIKSTNFLKLLAESLTLPNAMTATIEVRNAEFYSYLFCLFVCFSLPSPGYSTMRKLRRLIEQQAADLFIKDLITNRSQTIMQLSAHLDAQFMPIPILSCQCA
jgi:hypothetical protein